MDADIASPRSLRSHLRSALGACHAAWAHAAKFALDIGRDRGSPVSHYAAPFEFTGKLLKVTVAMHDDQALDGDGIGQAQMARQ